MPGTHKALTEQYRGRWSQYEPKQSIEEVESHQEASTDLGGNHPGEGAHRFNISSVKGSNLEDQITPLLEIPEPVFHRDEVRRIQEGDTSS